MGKFRYKVTHGSHAGKDANGVCTITRKDECFDSDQEGLEKRFPEKYARVSSDYNPPKPMQEEDVSLEIMDEDELRAYAEENDIDLGKVTKRESMIDRIKKAEAERAAVELNTDEKGDIDPEE